MKNLIFGEGNDYTLAFPQAREGREKHLIINFSLFVDTENAIMGYLPPCRNMDSPVTPDYKMGNPLQTIFIGSYKFPEIPLFGMN